MTSRSGATASVTRIAQVVHEAVRSWQRANRQDAVPSWSRAPKWMKDASRNAVIWRLANPGASPSLQHEQWVAEKKAEGWKYGRAKSGVKKTHPMLVPYRDLPEIERRKDAMVGALIDSLVRPLR